MALEAVPVVDRLVVRLDVSLVHTARQKDSDQGVSHRILNASCIPIRSALAAAVAVIVELVPPAE